MTSVEGSAEESRTVRLLVVGAVDKESLPWLSKKVAKLHARSGPFDRIFVTGWRGDRIRIGSSQDTGLVAEVQPFPIRTILIGDCFADSLRETDDQDNDDAKDRPVDSLGQNMEMSATVLKRWNLECLSGGSVTSKSERCTEKIAVCQRDDALGGAVVVVWNGSDAERLEFQAVEKQVMIESGATTNGFRGIDVLVTKSIQDDESASIAAVRTTRRWGLQLRPRFHFAAAVHPQAPYMESEFAITAGAHTTRYIELADASQTTKRKWAYALATRALSSLASTNLPSVSPTTNPCPYQDTPTKRRRVMEPRPSYPRLDPNAKCWFCLDSQKDTHLVTHIGNHIYVALAKGGLVPQHVLLVPIQHFRSSLTFDIEARTEIQKFKLVTKDFFADQLQSDLVVFERCAKTSGGERHGHCHIQCVPIPTKGAKDLENILENHARKIGISLEKVKDQASWYEAFRKHQLDPEQASFFYLEFPDG